MKYSLILLSGASLALAGPVAPRDAVVVYDVVTDIVTEVTYYTVTAEAPAPPTSTSVPVVVVTVTADPSYSPAPAPPAPAPTTTPTTTSSSSTPVAQVQVAAATPSTSSFEQIALDVHNAHRANNSAAALTYDDTYAGYAATLAARCTFEHDVTIGSPSEPYGQNIAMWASTDFSSKTEDQFLQECIGEMWYNAELPLYPSYGDEPDMTNFEAWGHYSQVVWKASTTLGCHVQTCAAGTMEPSMQAYFCVCNYFPAGNVDTEYATNVGAPVGEATVDYS